MQTNSKETEMIRILQKEAEAEFAAARIKSGFRFTGEQVKFLIYLMDKHGDDFKVFILLWDIIYDPFSGSYRMTLYTPLREQLTCFWSFLYSSTLTLHTPPAG